MGSEVKLRLGTSQLKPVLAAIVQQLPHAHDQLLRYGDAKMGIELDIKAIKAKQTDEQRGYYWRSLHFWGFESGYSAKEAETWLHNAVCCEAFGVLKRVQVRGSIIEVPKMTSSKLSIDDYSLLIETMIRLAAEEGVVVPPAERAA